MKYTNVAHMAFDARLWRVGLLNVVKLLITRESYVKREQYLFIFFAAPFRTNSRLVIRI